MAENLFIPKKLKVGFQNRGDTFNGKLAYVIYYDEKGKLRKEGSWKSWCDSKIPSIEIDNVPTPNFVLNKGIHASTDWGSDRVAVRVHDPRDFELEIKVSNLMSILAHSDVTKRDIVQDMVYAWNKDTLVLLPTNSEAYQNAIKFTEKQDKKVGIKELIEGATYSVKKEDILYTYLGHFDKWDFKSVYVDLSDSYHGSNQVLDKIVHTKIGKKHWFYADGYFYDNIAGKLAECVSKEVDQDYAAWVEKFFGTTESQKIVGIEFVPKKCIVNNNRYWYKQYANTDDSTYYEGSLIYNTKNIEFRKGSKREVTFEDSIVINYSKDYAKDNSYYSQFRLNADVEFTRNAETDMVCDIYYVLENGKLVKED